MDHDSEGSIGQEEKYVDEEDKSGNFEISSGEIVEIERIFKELEELKRRHPDGK